MKNIELIKQYIGIASASIGLFGGALAALFALGFSANKNTYLIFSVPGGASSNVPFLFGILAFSGVWLLASIKNE